MCLYVNRFEVDLKYINKSWKAKENGEREKREKFIIMHKEHIINYATKN